MNWSIENSYPGIEIKNNYLFVDKNVPEGYEIIINGTSINNEYNSTKKIKVKNNNYEGTLVHFYIEDSNYQGNDFIWNCWSFEREFFW